MPPHPDTMLFGFGRDREADFSTCQILHRGEGTCPARSRKTRIPERKEGGASANIFKSDGQARYADTAWI